jgi:hypothetical protein
MAAVLRANLGESQDRIYERQARSHAGEIRFDRDIPGSATGESFFHFPERNRD